MPAEREIEEPEAIHAAALGFFFVLVNREAGDHRDVGIHIVADRHTFFLEDAIILVRPLLSVLG